MCLIANEIIRAPATAIVAGTSQTRFSKTAAMAVIAAFVGLTHRRHSGCVFDAGASAVVAPSRESPSRDCSAQVARNRDLNTCGSLKSQVSPTSPPSTAESCSTVNVDAACRRGSTRSTGIESSARCHTSVARSRIV